MENNCKFVSSRGILKSCDFHSSNPMSSWCYDTNYLENMCQSNNMYNGMSIYICNDVIPFFLNNILPKINHHFYLISGDSDATVPNGFIYLFNNPIKLEETICLEILNNQKLIKWYSQNCILIHPKIHQLPIGLDYHTISNDPSKFWRDNDEGSSPKIQEMILKNIIQNMSPFYQRKNKIFVQMTIGNEECHRRKALNQIPEELLEINSNKMPRTKVWKEIINYSFAFSPYGNGPDCHRHWELLSLGCIPIIKSFGSNSMFEDLPVLIVNEWSDINRKLLDDTLEKFKYTNFNYDKLLLKYWVDKFS